MDHWDVALVAKAACFGGHAAVLQWLERDAGMYDVEHKRQEINMDLAAAAAHSGHVSLLQRQMAKVAAPRKAARMRWRLLFCDVALGCPLPVFRDLAEQWRRLGPPRPPLVAAADEDGGAILLHALWSRTPDWKEKVELVLARRPDLLAAVTADQLMLKNLGHNLINWAAAYPDFEQRLRYLVSDKGAGVPPAAAAAAARAGHVGALRFLLDECGVQLSDDCIWGAADRGQHAVLEFLRGRGQLPSFRCDGRTLDASAAPACVLAATAATAGFSGVLTSGFWSRVLTRAVRQGADVAALRYLHEQLGAEVQLQPIAEAGSVEQLEWALGVAAGAAGAAYAAAAQGPAPAAQHLQLAALATGNTATASHLHARGVAPVLPAADQVLTPGPFIAVRWLVQQRLAVQAAAADGAGAGGAGAGGAAAVAEAGAAGRAAAVGEAASVGEAAAAGGASGEAAVGLANAEWDKLLAWVGEDGRLRGRFSENQWEWLRTAFLASAVLPHATAASTADGQNASPVTQSGVVKMTYKREQAAAASAGAGGSEHNAAAGARADHERDRERLEEVMAVRRLVVAGVERRFREAVVREEALKADECGEAEYRSQYRAYYSSSDDGGGDDDDNDDD
ncbi:hypothetical protein HXX76_005932 [Chlamydomonas incerta]|uniref:Uncharacterized protein n=1 Tax=Chlamydomonas incerta TaxID=51695 RepID=A0A835T1U7_CHLIN|nr:hypothetical protein HXX76_005932 [Chlamydomonas incerta]|eukprot:KAG2437273.1 hypothetical protein HXX76_005932 [Chlamydomonas incerta]